MDAFGFGARAPALGSAYAALADDAAAGYYNPAGLARGTDLRIDIGYQAALPRLSFSDVTQPIEATRGLALGLVAPGNLLGLRLAFGLTLFLPDQHLTRLRVLRYEQPRLQLYDNRTQRFFMAANLAVRIWRGLYVGGGLTFMSRTRGDVSLRGYVTLGDPERSALYTRSDVDLVALRYPQAGILWEITPRIAVAAVYRHGFLLEIDQGFNIYADVGNPGTEPAVRGASLVQRAYSVDLFQPWQLVAAVAARLPFFSRRDLLVSLDVTFARHSEMPAPAARFDLELDIGKLNDLVRLQPSRPYPSPGFHDILIPALGLEWRAAEGLAGERLDLDVRAGYRYEPSPVPAQSGETSFGDADKHALSAGLGTTLRRLPPVLSQPLALDVFCAVIILPERRFYKLDPRSPVGDFTVSGAVFQLGGQLRWRF